MKEKHSSTHLSLFLLTHAASVGFNLNLNFFSFWHAYYRGHFFKSAYLKSYFPVVSIKKIDTKIPAPRLSPPPPPQKKNMSRWSFRYKRRFILVDSYSESKKIYKVLNKYISKEIYKALNKYILFDGLTYNTRGYFASCRAMSKTSARIIC